MKIREGEPYFTVAEVEEICGRHLRGRLKKDTRMPKASRLIDQTWYYSQADVDEVRKVLTTSKYEIVAVPKVQKAKVKKLEGE